MAIGEALAAAREHARLTVEDVSRATRIRGELVRRIEADDFTACGGAVYARGHIRAIAAHLGIDPAPLVVEFDRLHGVDGPAPHQIFEREVLAMPERTGPNWTAAMAVMAGVLLMIALVSLFNTDPSRPQTTTLGTSLTSPSPSANEPARPTASPTPGELAGQVPGSGVFLRVKITNSKSYVTVHTDGKKSFQGLLATGAQMDFNAKRLIRVVIGNAAAVNLLVNGRDLGSPGRPGQVVRLEFGPGDPATTA